MSVIHELTILESGTTILRTPLVDIELIDENGNNLTFDIIDSFDPKHSDYLREIDRYLTPAKNNYDEKLIRIATNTLELGKKYYVKTSKPIEYRDSDEHLFTYGRTEDMQTFAISFPDPNDDEKMDGYIYSRTPKMKWYNFEDEDKEGTKAVSFYLIDREKEYIYISAVWIWDIFDNMFNYETAAELFTWLWIV